MEQRDLIKDQIEQLGRVLGKLIANFLGLKGEGKVAQGIVETNQQLKEVLTIDISLILNLDKIELDKYITSKNLTADHIVQLADYVSNIGDHQSDSAAKTDAFSSALNLYELANARSDTFDLERNYREQTIIKKLKDLG